jgi:hypothetical protein
VQVVKWRQETVRCEEARGALEAEVVDTRTQLLEQQQCRARSIKALVRRYYGAITAAYEGGCRHAHAAPRAAAVQSQVY